MNIEKTIGEYGLIPVVVLQDADRAVPVADALARGGLPVMEVTLRTEAGVEAIAKVSAQRPEILLGAGTVLTLEQCRAALSAGAKFIVSPGFSEDIVRHCIESGVPVFPGCVTPSELDKALSYGIKTVKFFPANVYGGVKGCQALYGPYASSGVRFIPTGGVDANNLSEYASQNYICAVGGGWLAKPAWIEMGDYQAIAEEVKKAVKILLGFEFAHVGINLDSAREAHEVSDAFLDAFGFEKKVGNSSIFSSGGIEVCMNRGRGDCGHIAVRTNSVERALAYLGMHGYGIAQDSIKYNADGSAKFAYLSEQIGGFAVHLIQK